MADQKVTIMVLKVDLQCSRCYKKIKRVLCKFPQIRDQVFDEKTNTIVIKVVCCSPEKIKQKIICKAGDTLKSIEIKEPEKPKPKEPEKPKEKPKEPEKPKEKPKEPEKPKEKPKEPEKPKEKPKEKPPAEKPKDNPPAPAPAPAPPKSDPPPVPMCYPPPAYTFGTCCGECYQGHPAGPCYQSYGGPPPQCYQYDGYYGRPVYDSYGGGAENPGACSIM
ncbi:hypothetical protein UlMin_017529 [Ulmus minor]